jgi:nucleotide-binding universal stress UspA family protein
MYDRILVPLDGSKMAECVIPHVLKITQDSKSKEVILLRVCEPVSILADYPANMKEPWEDHVKAVNEYSSRQCQMYLDTVEEELKAAGLKNLTTVGCLGNPANEIVNYVEKNNIDMVIMATHGRSGAGRWAYGSVAEKVLRSTCAAVLVIKGPGCIIGV